MGTMRTLNFPIAVVCLCALGSGTAFPEEWMPDPIGDEDFAELSENSPFTRALNLPGTLVVTGVAVLGPETLVTLVDRETKETLMISTEADDQGRRLIDLDGDLDDLSTVTAHIAAGGGRGEIVIARFDESLMDSSALQQRLAQAMRKPGYKLQLSSNGGIGFKRIGERSNDPEERRRQSEQVRELSLKVRNFRKENPKATEKEKREFVEKMNRSIGA